MGSFSIPCPISRAYIQEGDPVIGVLLDLSKEFYAEDYMYYITENLFRQLRSREERHSLGCDTPFIAVCRGTYDDGGGIDGLDVADEHKLILFHEWAANALLPDVVDLQSVAQLFKKMRLLNITVADLMSGEQWPSLETIQAQLELNREIVRQLELQLSTELISNYLGDFKVPIRQVEDFKFTQGLWEVGYLSNEDFLNEYKDLKV